MAYKTLYDIQLAGKRVLLRAGFDMPIDEEGNITDDRRIVAGLPTIRFLLEYGAKIIILNHYGRPVEREEKYNHNKIAELLSKHLHITVKKLDDCIGEQVEKMVMTMKPGEVVLLENLRFHPEESDKNNEVRDKFGQQLAKLGEIYVNDAFANCHRDHASMTSIPKFLPSCAGFLVQRETDIITKTMNHPRRPFIAILGGAKLATKIPIIRHLLPKVDKILLGGAMIFTFFKAQGLEVGSSLVDQEDIPLAYDLLAQAKDKIILPTDVVITKALTHDASGKIVSVHTIPHESMGADIGPETIEQYIEIVQASKTIIWNGPLGVYEIPAFAKGTDEIAKAMKEMSNTTIIIGGGDIAAVFDDLGLSKSVTHVSTGGGASLALFSGEELPAMKALEESV